MSLSFRLPASLEPAVRRIKLAVRAAGERTAESLGLAALSAAHNTQRELLLQAQFELQRKAAIFALAFEEAYDRRIASECAPRVGTRHTPGSTNWGELSLVDDHEVELEIAAERFGMEIAHACEWELRELEGYVGSALEMARIERERNPMRPELIGHALIRGIDKVVDVPEGRRMLLQEFTRSLASLLRETYVAVIADLRQAGVRPAGLTVRTSEDRGDVSRAGALDGTPDGAAARGGTGAAPQGQGPGLGAHHGQGAGGGALLGQVQPSMMGLLRRLSFVEVADAGFGDAGGGPAARAMLPNLIHAHRDELRHASRGGIDHLVIDVIANLFDQILADPKVPPELAREIARLQLPVLRAALGDPGFFASRRHPVRRFVNRIASLGAGFDDYTHDQAKAFLAKVHELVQAIVEGDFERVDLYEAKLDALEAFAIRQARNAMAGGADEASRLLARKEDELRLVQLYGHQLQVDLGTLPVPDFLRDFVAQVWSHVMLTAAEADGGDSERVQRLRRAGRDLLMSVQPKSSPAQRKAFLAELPALMQDLNAGMDLIGWPEAAKRAFFGQLLPSHAEVLKAQPVRTLDYNLMSRQAEQALARKPPTREDLPPISRSGPVATGDGTATHFSTDEATRVGLLPESAVDWDGKVDIDLGAEPEVQPQDLSVPGLPSPTEVEPVSGRSLADHVQIGFSYRMHLEGRWQKARLAHFSPGRAFFVFTLGQRHQRTVSLTQRMLVRMCESGRLRAFESAYLIERATARARRQLAEMGARAAPPH